MANRYWVGNSGFWTDPAHWSATSGGSGGASVPGVNDAVFFNANSFTLAGQKVEVATSTPYAIYCGSVDFTGCLNNPSFDFYYSSSIKCTLFYVYGNLTFIPGVVFGFQPASGPYSIYIPSGRTCNLTTNGNTTILGFVVLDGGTLNLLDNLANIQTLDILGTFNTNGYNIDMMAPLISSNVFRIRSTAVANLSSSIISMSGIGSFTIMNTPTITGTYTLKFYYYAAISVTAPNIVFNDIYFYKGSQLGLANWQIGGAFACNNWYITSLDYLNVYDRVLKFLPGTIITVNGNFLLENPSDIMTYGGFSMILLFSGVPFQFIKVGSGTTLAYNTAIRDSTVSGGSGWYAIDSTDGGNNTGWIFGDPPAPTAIYGEVYKGNERIFRVFLGSEDITTIFKEGKITGV
jgi:hypothetical protein